MSFVAIKSNSHNLKKIIWAGGEAIHSTYLGCPQFLSALTLRYLEDKEWVPRMVFAPLVFASHLYISIKKDGDETAERGGTKERDINKHFLWFSVIVKM